MPETIDRTSGKHFSYGLLPIVLFAAGVGAYFVYQHFGGVESGSGGRVRSSAPRMSDRESHDKMVVALARIAEDSTFAHPYLGIGSAARLRQLLQDPKSIADVRKSCELHFAAGLAEARLGNLRESIRFLTRAYELIDAAKLEIDDASYVRFKLGVAYMRLGETENCCTSNGSESCILPIRDGGVHAKKEGSTQAIRYLEEVLRSGAKSESRRSDGSSNSAPTIRVHLASRWLLNIAYMTLGKYPDAVPEEWRMPGDIFRSAIEFPRFVNVATKARLDTFNLCGSAIVDDFDNDGYLDVIASSWDPLEQLRFFRSKADGTFADVTEKAGLRGIIGGLNIIQTDFDNDGNLDVLVLRGAWLGSAGQHPNSLLRNNGNGTFTDVTFASGLGVAHYPTQTADWADYDNDGDLDLFVGNEHTNSQTAPCQLFRNEGDGTFSEVAALAGVQNFRFAKGVSFGDFDGDRFADLYVSNYAAPNRLYKNNGDGTFEDVAERLGVTAPRVSFPTWFFDYDNDGVLDLFVASYTGRIDSTVGHYLGEPPDYEPAGFYRGDGRGGFVDVTEALGMHVPMLPMGSNFGDLNNDGFLDFYLGTGDPDYETLMPNLMFLNKSGSGFIDVTMAGGFGHLQKGHGVAFADLDNDGDADVFEQMGGAFAGDRFGDALFENPGFGNHWLAVKLVGKTSNRAAIGARIEVQIVEEGRSRSIFRHVNSGGSFGANPLQQTIGLGKAQRVEVLKIYWPATGRTQTFTEVPVDQFLRVVEDESEFGRIQPKRFKLGG